jgi:hypothetical protein
LRALSAAKLLEMAGKFGAFQYNPIVVRFTPTVDGYFFPKAPAQIFTRPTPLPNPKAGPARARGARHSAEIEYVLGNLDRSPMYAWTAEDRAVSEVAQGYFVRFIESGDPNTTGLPTWPPYSTGRRMILDVQPRAQMDAAAVRGRLFDDLQPR